MEEQAKESDNETLTFFIVNNEGLWLVRRAVSDGESPIHSAENVYSLLLKSYPLGVGALV